MELRLRLAVLAVIGVIGAIALWNAPGLPVGPIAFGTPSLAGEEPLGRTPRGATAMVWIDAPAVVESPLWRDVLEGAWGLGANAAGASRSASSLHGLEDACGSEPVEMLDEVVVFTLAEEDAAFGPVGVVATGRLDHGRLVRCVGRWATADGATPRATTIAGLDALAVGSSRVAFVGADAAVAGDEETVTAVARLRDTSDASASGDVILGRLWSAVAPERHVVAVARVPRAWQRSVARALADRGEADALIASIRALAVGLRLGPVLDFEARAAMENPGDAARAAVALTGWTEAALERAAIARSPLGVVLRQTHIEPQEDDVRVTVALSPAQVLDLVDVVAALVEGSGNPSEPTPPPADLPPSETHRR